MSADLLQQSSLRDLSVYDELSSDGIQPRPHWAGMLQSLESMGSGEVARRWARAERRIRENGVTYNVYDDAQGASRPWSLDLIPLMISPEEWRDIESGIVQRARLLDRVLADLYGPQDLLRNGHLPPELVFASPEFLRPVAGDHLPRTSHLHLLAMDLARSPDGQWWVLADRTQAPSGAAYALENRLIIAEALPDLFRESNVRRLAHFFRAERDALMRLAACDHPRIVVLTPGPFNETYFEHSYLARYLGFTLAEGGDLTVRDRRVYLKTVEGLRPVDVIFRRVDDSFCDPLELRGDSFLGVPGLVEAVIAGNVKVANSLGSGLIETAATMPFLPGLSKLLLGENLKLPSVATWWCGQDYALNWVLDHLDAVVVKPAFPARRMEPVFGVQLSRTEKERLTAQMRAWPHEYVAQEQVALSTAPVWDNGRLLPRSMVLRTYVLNTGTEWIALPGGLVRVAVSEGSVVSMQRGGHSKDAWVISKGPVDTFSLLRRPDQPLELCRGSVDLPSRVADDLFWLGRYAERAENIARLLRTSLSSVRRADEGELRCLTRLHRCFETRQSKLPKKRPPTTAELETELVSLMSDPKRQGSLTSTLEEVHRVAGRVRDRLSTDMMRLIGLLRDSARVEEYMLFVEYSVALSGCLEQLSAFSGMERENVTRGPGWLFLSLGRRLERAMYTTAELLELTAPFEDADRPFLEYLLEVADSAMTYRSRYFTTMHPVAVMDVLMTDATNPRSLHFHLSHLADLYAKLPRPMAAVLDGMREMTASLGGLDLRPLAAPERDHAAWNSLKRLLQKLSVQLPSWSTDLSGNYFTHAFTHPTTTIE